MQGPPGKMQRRAARTGRFLSLSFLKQEDLGVLSALCVEVLAVGKMGKPGKAGKMATRSPRLSDGLAAKLLTAESLELTASPRNVANRCETLRFVAFRCGALRLVADLCETLSVARRPGKAAALRGSL